MGHLLFIVLHLVALLFGMVGLFITVPLHLIYGATSRRREAPPAPRVDEPHPSTHVRCPDCRELVRMDANKCKHCGAALVPQPAAAKPARAGSSLWIMVAIGLAAIIAIQLLGVLSSR